MTEEKLKPTWTEEQRRSRIELLRAEIQEKKRLSLADVYRFALSNLRVSIRIIDDYLKELKLAESISVEPGPTPQETFLAWVEEDQPNGN